VEPSLTVRSLRPFLWPAVLVFVATVAYAARVQHHMVDFAVYRQAAERALAAEPLYRGEDGHYQFKYLPAFAFAMAPFALLPDAAARAVWFALSVALLVVLVRWSIRALPGRRLSVRALGWLTILFLGKFYANELNLGQTNILLGVLLLGALLAVQAGRTALAGALVGAGIFVKPYAVILLPWLLVASNVSAVLVAGGILVAGLALPVAVYGLQGAFDELVAWFITVTGTSPPNLLVAENISIATMWAKWVGPGAPATGLAVATAGAAIGAAALVVRRRHASEEPAYLEFGLLMLLVPLLSPQGWDYVLLLATPAVILLFDRLGTLARPWRVVTVIALAGMGLTIFDVLGRALYSSLMRVSVVSVCALVLVASLARLRWQGSA
jgi:hypothetical protein